MVEIRTILVPTDFSDCAAVAVRYAKELAEKFGSAVHLLHVIPDSAFVLPEAIVPPVMQVPDISDLKAQTDSSLQAAVAQFGLANLKIECESRLGSPADEIVAAAKDANADLIVIGTHGRSAIAHFLLGSVVDKVVRHAHCPVLTVRKPVK